MIEISFKHWQNCILPANLEWQCLPCRVSGMCAMCGYSPDKNWDQKCEAVAFPFFFFVNRLCPIALLARSCESGRDVGLCSNISVVTRHCQCVRCLFLHVPQRSAAKKRGGFLSSFLSARDKGSHEERTLPKPLVAPCFLRYRCVHTPLFLFQFLGA